MNIEILVTGGTFDKEYDEVSGKLFFKDTHLPEMLGLGRSRINIDIQTLMMIDSLDMTDKDRDLIVNYIRKTDTSHLIITHGTDKMVTTAKYLHEADIQGKTIVMTGAIIPYKFGSSDGVFNLGSALAFAQMLPRGVYIVMNGRYFHPDNCTKNIRTGEFEELH